MSAVNRILQRYGIYCKYQSFYSGHVFINFFLRFDARNSLLKFIQDLTCTFVYVFVYTFTVYTYLYVEREIFSLLAVNTLHLHYKD